MCWNKKIKRALKLGDKVQVKGEQVWFSLEFPDEKIVTATEGSIGIIVSFDEYRLYKERELRRRGVSEPTPKEYKNRYVRDEKDIKRGLRYPVKWERVVPVADPDVTVWSKEGCIQMIAASVLEKVE